MATIKLYASKINQMSGLIKDVKKSVIDYKSELSSLRSKTITIDKSVCDLEDIISQIQASTKIQDLKLESLETFSKNVEQFVTDVVKIDSDVADLINQRKEEFYNKYNYLKAVTEI
jgi:hypothetical protein